MAPDDHVGEGLIAGVVPLALCAPFDRSAAPLVVEQVPDLRRASAVASAWQRYDASAQWAEAWGFSYGLQRNRMFNLRTYQAAAGEKLALACTVGLQAALWLRERAGEGPIDAVREMAHRATGEMQAYFLLSAGHDLINITARILALDETLHPALYAEAGSVFEPDADDRDAYLSLTAQRAKRLAAVARTAERWPAMREVVEPVRALAGDAAFTRMVTDRNEVFHRRRPPSAGRAQSPGTGWELNDAGVHVLTLSALTLGEPRAAAYTQTLAQVLGPVTSAFEQLDARLDEIRVQISG